MRDFESLKDVASQRNLPKEEKLSWNKGKTLRERECSLNKLALRFDRWIRILHYTTLPNQHCNQNEKHYQLSNLTYGGITAMISV